MKLTFRDLYSDNVGDLIYNLLYVDILSDVCIMPDPVKYVHINNIPTKSKLAFMPIHRPIIIPFRVGKYNLRLDYNNEL